EAIARRGGTRHLGISNVTRRQLDELLGGAEILPRFVQNRCFARLGWDLGVRQLCAARGIDYQGFSLLTANRDVVAHPTLQAIAARLDCTPAQVVFAFALRSGMQVLTGTKSVEHMGHDLAAVALAPALRADELAAIATLSMPDAWSRWSS